MSASVHPEALGEPTLYLSEPHALLESQGRSLVSVESAGWRLCGADYEHRRVNVQIWEHGRETR